MKSKKIAAVMMAATMGVGCLPVNVQAADSYKEAEKAAVTKVIEQFCHNYAKNLDEKTDFIQNASNFELILSEEGNSLLNLAASTDLSWINSISLNTQNGFSKESSSQSIDLNLNGVKICTINCYIDTADSAIYISIPELSDGYIKTDLINTGSMTDNTYDDSDSFHVQMQYADILENYFNGMENLPDAETLQSVLERYAGIILDNVVEDGSIQQTVAAGNVEEQFTVLEAEIDQYAAASMVKKILETAKTDKELETLIETYSRISTDPDFTYDNFLMSLEDMETELNGDWDLGNESLATQENSLTDNEMDVTPSEISEGGCVRTELASENTFCLKSYMNERGEIVGRELSAKENQEEIPLLKYLQTENEDKKGFLLTLGDGADSFTLEGSGTENAGMFNGFYTISSEEQEIATVDIVDLDTAALKDGYLNGTYLISGTYDADAALNGMFISFTSDGTKDKLDINASLSLQNTYLGTIYITSEDKTGLDIPDKDSIRDIYDFSKEENVQEYMTGMDMSIIMGNLAIAGMPEEWLEDMTGDAEETEMNNLTWDIEAETGDKLMQLQTTE